MIPMGRFGVTIEELQRNMREGLRKARRRRENHSKVFNPRSISNYQQQPETRRDCNSTGISQPLPPTFNYNIYNNAQNPNQPEVRRKDFDLGLFLILTAIVVVFLWVYDHGFRGVIMDLYERGIGQLQPLDSGTMVILGLLVVVLVIYLVSRRK